MSSKSYQPNLPDESPSWLKAILVDIYNRLNALVAGQTAARTATQQQTNTITQVNYGIKIGNITIYGGAAAPNGSAVGTPGDLYLQERGSLWVKDSGVATATGWKKATLT